MSIVKLERKILSELREVVGDRKLVSIDFTEWRTSEFEAPEGERVVFLPEMRVWASYLVR